MNIDTILGYLWLIIITILVIFTFINTNFRK
jgi:hypothetical protein